MYNFLTLVCAWIATNCGPDGPGLEFRHGQKKNLCCPKFLTPSGAHRDSYSMGTGVLSWRKRSRGVNLTTRLHLMSRWHPSIRPYGVEWDKFVFFSVTFLLSNEIQNSSIRSSKNIDLIYGHRYLMYSERLRQSEGRRCNLQQDI